VQSATKTRSQFVAATFEGRGRDQSRTWWEILEAFDGYHFKDEAERLCVRISVASGGR
jgi:hypothetical protein